MIGIVAVIVGVPVIVVALVNGNDIVDVADAVDGRQVCWQDALDAFETSNLGGAYRPAVAETVCLFPGRRRALTVSIRAAASFPIPSAATTTGAITSTFSITFRFTRGQLGKKSGAGFYTWGPDGKRVD